MFASTTAPPESKSKIEIREFPKYPRELRLKDLKENGSLLTDEELKRIIQLKHQFADIKAPVIFSKKTLALPYRGLFEPATDEFYTIYKGKNAAKHNPKTQSPESKNDSDSEDESGVTLPYILGEGQYGTVKIAQHSTTKTLHAIKFAETDSVSQEIKMLKRTGKFFLSTQHVSKSKLKKYDVFVMELAPGIDLHKYHKSHKLPSHRLIEIILGMLNCLKEIQDKEIVHRDIKLINFRIEPVSGRITLIDFGFAAACKKSQTLEKMLTGSPGHIAPEYITLGQLTHQSDIYSIGIAIAMLLSMISEKSRQPPWQDFLRGERYFELINPEKKSAIKEEGLHHKILEFLSSMLSKEPAQRPQVDECIKFFNGIQREIFQNKEFKIGVVNLDDVIQPKDQNFNEMVQLLKQENYDEIWFVDTHGKYTAIQKEQLARRFLRRNLPIADKIFTSPGAHAADVIKQIPQIMTAQKDMRKFVIAPVELTKPQLNQSVSSNMMI